MIKVLFVGEDLKKAKGGIASVMKLILEHPYLKEKTDWRKFYELAEKYGYKLMNMSEFYEKYLKNVRI